MKKLIIGLVLAGACQHVAAAGRDDDAGRGQVSARIRPARPIPHWRCAASWPRPRSRTSRGWPCSGATRAARRATHSSATSSRSASYHDVLPSGTTGTTSSATRPGLGGARAIVVSLTLRRPDALDQLRGRPRPIGALVRPETSTSRRSGLCMAELGAARQLRVAPSARVSSTSTPDVDDGCRNAMRLPSAPRRGVSSIRRMPCARQRSSVASRSSTAKQT